MKKPVYLIARGLSTFFIPPTLFLFTFVFLALFFESPENTIPVIFTTMVFGVMIPIVLFAYLVKTKKIINQDATNKEERTAPYIYGIILYAIGLIILYLSNAGDLVMTVWFAYLLNTFVILVINKFWKISAHAMGVAGPLGLFYFLFGIYSYPLFVLLLVIAWSRIYLKCHTPLQVAMGSIYGFFSVYLLLNFLLN